MEASAARAPGYEEREQEKRRAAAHDAAAERMDAAALSLKESLGPLAEAIKVVPPQLLQELTDANLNAHHALGRVNSARAMLERIRA